MIDSIRENLREVKETIYNAAGQTLNRLQRGVNIIRKSDGTVTKEIRKWWILCEIHSLGFRENAWNPKERILKPVFQRNN